MNFKDLKIIINQIKRDINCPCCKKKYLDEEIEIIGTQDGEQHYFHAFCEDCKAESIIHVAVEEKNRSTLANPADPTNLDKLGSAPRMGKISQNEVLDMYNFLKNFDGNFKRLFKNRQNT